MLNSHSQVKVYLGLWRQYSALKIIHTIPSVLVWHDCCFVLVYCFGLVYCLVLVLFFGRVGGFGVGFFCEIFRVVFCLFGWLVFLFGCFLWVFWFCFGGVLGVSFCFSGRPKIIAQLFPPLSSFLCLLALTADKCYPVLSHWNPSHLLPVSCGTSDGIKVRKALRF